MKIETNSYIARVRV